jgi:hypothetical protein
VTTRRGTAVRDRRSNYELFNRNNFSIRYWSWNYRGCWHQTCPPIDPRWAGLNRTHSDDGPRKRTASLYFVTTSPFWEWVICAPAAFLRCGSRFSGSLSGVEPLFPVTRYNHGKQINYRRKLIRQTFERCVAGAKTVRSAELFRFANRTALRPFGFCSNKCARSARSELCACISSRITAVIQVGK